RALGLRRLRRHRVHRRPGRVLTHLDRARARHRQPHVLRQQRQGHGPRGHGLHPDVLHLRHPLGLPVTTAPTPTVRRMGPGAGEATSAARTRRDPDTVVLWGGLALSILLSVWLTW